MKKTLRALTSLTVLAIASPLMVVSRNLSNQLTDDAIFVAKNQLCRTAGVALMLLVGGATSMLRDRDAARLCVETALELYR